MSAKRYVVQLSAGERAQLRAVVAAKKGVSPEKRKRAEVLLRVDEGKLGPSWTDERAAEAFDVHVTTVSGLRQRLVEEGFERALNRKPQRNPSWRASWMARPRRGSSRPSRVLCRRGGPSGRCDCCPTASWSWASAPSPCPTKPPGAR